VAKASFIDLCLCTAKMLDQTDAAGKLFRDNRIDATVVTGCTVTMTSFPQAIAHRGYSAAFPENTMAAFLGAVEVGAQAIETDVHLSKDGVVVLSHVSFCRFPQTKVDVDTGVWL
jgi:glycerophosphoryl diester phosphodiesterase